MEDLDLKNSNRIIKLRGLRRRPIYNNFSHNFLVTGSGTGNLSHQFEGEVSAETVYSAVGYAGSTGTIGGVTLVSDAAGSGVENERNSAVVKYSDATMSTVEWVAQIRCDSTCVPVGIAEQFDDGGCLIVVAVTTNGNTPVKFYDEDGVQRAANVNPVLGKTYFASNKYHREIFCAKYDKDGAVEWTKRLVTANSTTVNVPNGGFTSTYNTSPRFNIEHLSYFRGNWRIYLNYWHWASYWIQTEDYALCIDDASKVIMTWPAGSGSFKRPYSVNQIQLDDTDGSASRVSYNLKTNVSYLFGMPAMRISTLGTTYDAGYDEDGGFCGREITLDTGQTGDGRAVNVNVGAEGPATYLQLVPGPYGIHSAEYRPEVDFGTARFNRNAYNASATDNRIEFTGARKKTSTGRTLSATTHESTTLTNFSFYKLHVPPAGLSNLMSNSGTGATNRSLSSYNPSGFAHPHMLITLWENPAEDIDDTKDGQKWFKFIYHSQTGSIHRPPTADTFILDEDNDVFWILGRQMLWPAQGTAFTMRFGNGEANQTDRSCPADGGLWAAKFKLSDGTYEGVNVFIDSGVGTATFVFAENCWLDDNGDLNMFFGLTNSIILDPDSGSPITRNITGGNAAEYVILKMDGSDGSYISENIIQTTDATWNMGYYKTLQHNFDRSWTGGRRLTPAPASPSTSPTLYLKMDDSEFSGGTITPTISPGGLTGTYTGVTSVSGEIGEARQMTTNGQGMKFDSTAFRLGAATDMSISVKFKTNITTNGVIFASDNFGDNTSDGLYYLNMLANGTIQVNSRSSSSTRLTNTSRSFNDNAWHHLIVSWDRSGRVRIWVDGRLERDSTETDWNLDTDRSGQSEIFIGASDDLGITPVTQSTFIGSLDEFAFWHGTALTSDEAYALWLWQEAGNTIA